MVEQLTELEIQNNIRERNGMPPLTELPLKPEDIEAKKALEAEEGRKAEAKRKEDEAKAQKEKEDEEARQKGLGTTGHVELTDDVVLEYLKKKNPKIQSFDALNPKPTEEEILQEKETREAEKLAWALKNGKFKKKDFENYINDSKNPNNIVFNSFATRVMAANPETTPEELQSQFNERYGLDKDPESWQYKQGQEELSILANQHLQKNYGSIISLENEYSTFEQSQNQKNSTQAKILANAPAFKKDVEAVFGEVGTYKRTIEGKEYEVKLPEEFVTRIKNQFLSNDFVAEQIVSGWDKDRLKEIATNAALVEHQDFITQKVAEEYLKEKQKGSRGIPANLGHRAKETDKQLDENLQKAAERHGAVVPATQ